MVIFIQELLLLRRRCLFKEVTHGHGWLAEGCLESEKAPELKLNKGFWELAVKGLIPSCFQRFPFSPVFPSVPPCLSVSVCVFVLGLQGRIPGNQVSSTSSPVLPVHLSSADSLSSPEICCLGTQIPSSSDRQLTTRANPEFCLHLNFRLPSKDEFPSALCSKDQLILLFKWIVIARLPACFSLQPLLQICLFLIKLCCSILSGLQVLYSGLSSVSLNQTYQEGTLTLRQFIKSLRQSVTTGAAWDSEIFHPAVFKILSLTCKQH